MGPRSVSVGHYRPVDLATAAGISTQQVRNDGAAGVLPPVRRSESGYRVYTEQHLRALLTYRGLARAHGAPAARGVMRAVHDQDLAAALALIDISHSQLHEHRVLLQATQRTLGAVAGDVIADVRDDDDMLIGEVADALGVRTSTLRSWDAAGLVSPARTPRYGYRTYSPTDVRDARIAQQLRLSGQGIDQVRGVLGALRATDGKLAIQAAISKREDALTVQARLMLRAAAALAEYLDKCRWGVSPSRGHPRR